MLEFLSKWEEFKVLSSLIPPHKGTYFTRLPHIEINLAALRAAMFSFGFLMLLAWTAFSLLLPIAFSFLSIQVPLSTLAILPRDIAIKETVPPGCDVFLPLCHWRPAGLQAGGTGQGIGNVLYAPCMGLACIPITAWRASVPLRAENIWKHS